MKITSPKKLDEQSPIKVDRWIDMYSEECKVMDDNHELTVKWFKMLSADDTFFLDQDGRIWGGGSNGIYYPYHFEYGKKLYGYRIAKLAAN